LAGSAVPDRVIVTGLDCVPAVTVPAGQLAEAVKVMVVPEAVPVYGPSHPLLPFDWLVYGMFWMKIGVEPDAPEAEEVVIVPVEPDHVSVAVLALFVALVAHIHCDPATIGERPDTLLNTTGRPF
jgi:hypothetical protein